MGIFRGQCATAAQGGAAGADPIEPLNAPPQGHQVRHLRLLRHRHRLGSTASTTPSRRRPTGDGFTIDREELIPRFIDAQRDPARPYEPTPRSCGVPPCAWRGGAGLGPEPVLLELPAQQRARLAALRETNAQLERFAKKFEIGALSNIDDKLLGATRRHSPGGLRPRRHGAAGALVPPDPLHFKECARRIFEGAKNWVHDAAIPPTSSPRWKGQGPRRDLGQPPRRGARVGAEEPHGRGQDLPRRGCC